MGINKVLLRILNDWSTQAAKPLKGNELGDFIRHAAKDEVAKIVGDSYLVDSSPGKGNWAQVPWIAIFDESITVSAQNGFYLVYLFAKDSSGVFLTLNQATTEVQNEYKGSGYLEILKSRAAYYSSLIESSQTSDLEHGQIDLGATTGSISKGYEAGNVVAIWYPASNMPDDTSLQKDLNRFLDLYQSLINGLDIADESNSEELPTGVRPGIEARKFRWHRRAERNPRLAKDAKSYHGSTCQACGFNFGERYGHEGEGYIEAHHVVPFSELASRPEEVILDPIKDFVVLCANCHRMAHRVKPQLTVPEISHLISQQNRKEKA